jgi:predicted permease
LTESILLGAIGGGLGLLLAKIGMAGAIAAMPQTLPRAEEIGLDSRVLFFTLAVSVLAGILFGLAPTFRMQRANIAGDLKENSRAVARTRSHVQGAFVVAEMALALVLLVGAGLMIRTLFVLWTTDPGFNARNVLTFSVSTPTTLRSEPPAAIRAFFRQMHHTLASTPEIESTALSWGASPMEGDAESYFWFAGRPKPAHHTELPMALRYIVEPSYLKTLQIPLEQGRFLNDSDNERSEHVVVVDQSLAEKHFPLRNPIGQYLELAGNPIKIVGIASHVNQWGLGSDAARPLHAQIYLPLDQIPNKYMNFFAQNVRVYVRGKRDLPNFETLRARLLAMNSGFITYNDQPMERIVLATVAGKRFTMALLAVFAGIALVLASIGIYGVLSYLVGQRTQEIGVRMALGAARWDVMRMILTDGARLAAAGIAIGVVAALGLTHLMTSLLFGVKPTDVLTFVLVSCTLAVIALLACYLPARRAMQIDPMTALRNE